MTPRRPLLGKTVLVTRPKSQADGLARALARSGAKVIAIPAIKIVRPDSYKALDKAIRELASYDGVIFTSQNAVEHFFSRAKPSRRPCYAIGAKTAAALRRHGWRPTSVPEKSRGEALARSIPGARGKRFLLPRAREAREALPAMLRARGARVDVVEAYRTADDETHGALLRRLADAGALDAVTFASASTVESVARQLGAARWGRLMSRAAAGSIGPVTTSALRRRGVRRVVEAARADEASLAGVLARRLGDGR